MTATHDRKETTSKSAYVKEMFASIAPRYDLANRVLTAGFDEMWRNRAIDQLRLQQGDTILDLCCGTGDICFHLVRRDPTLKVTGVDFCPPMLERARERAHHEAPDADMQFLEADVMALPFADRSFDGATMGFSMRNVVDIDATLREIRRVLKPGARFVNLDVSKAPNPLFKRAFDVYFYGIVPLVGGIVGGSRSAYRYLPASLTHHPNAPALLERFTNAGFVDCGYRPLCGGTIAIHFGAAP
ncbi:MAG: bifunctional demethylmenaquinone methyltransferase/2-methoxy-6-polyprenyl-1,4-benzoquinol methylase UbiE [Candidatus Eremiobacteraeota bacterium]|nr:bifunctional demethylmenaquinone methyltransferase/2-methoxy-6-polyprenyl-1,4-benzoquinol methylase UbiE [Candidatus Eremiobacteraeota bacterium]